MAYALEIDALFTTQASENYMNKNKLTSTPNHSKPTRKLSPHIQATEIMLFILIIQLLIWL